MNLVLDGLCNETPSIFTTKQILLLPRPPTKFYITLNKLLLVSKYIYSPLNFDNIFTVRGVLSSTLASLGSSGCPLFVNSSISSLS